MTTDHERALQPLSPLEAISLGSVAPDAMTVVDREIAPLAPIAPLPVREMLGDAESRRTVMRKVWLMLLLLWVIPSVDAAAAQKPPVPPPAPPEDAAPATTGRKAPPPPPAAPTPDGRARKVGPNVRVEVMFSEQRSDTTATPKTVTITTNDGQWGRVRSR